MTQTTNYPPCQFAGRQITGRRFCRAPDLPRLVTPAICNGCRHSAVESPTQQLPQCTHRGQAVASIISCNCPESFRKPVFQCQVHEKCVLTRHNRENITGVKCCETCPDCSSRPTHTASLNQLAIIAVHFNPQRYALPIRNYWEWQHHLGSLSQNLTTIELSFDGQFCIPDSIRISGNQRHVMWQKEALINAAVKQLPPSIKFVAWIDHDLIFANPDWANCAVSMLANGFDVVQLFDRIEYTAADRSVIDQRQAFAAHFLSGQPVGTPSAPGGAWAARRDYFTRIGGLPDNNIVGGADQLACDAWLNRDSHYLTIYPPKLAEAGQAWKHQATTSMRGDCGFVPGKVKHLFHGTRANRHYLQRAEILRRHAFDPQSDIRINADGVCEWSSNKPRLHAAIAEYFAIRNEDADPAPPKPATVPGK